MEAAGFPPMAVVPKVGGTAPQGALARFRGAVRRKGAIGGQ